MFEIEKTYFTKNIVLAAVGSLIALSIIVSIGIYLFSFADKNLHEPAALDVASQSLETARMTSELTYKIVSSNADNSFEQIDSYLKDPLAFKFSPAIEFKNINFENVPALYFKNQKIASTDDEPNNFAKQIKKDIGIDVAFYQRINEQGDMLLSSTSFAYPLSNLIYISAIAAEDEPQPFISSILKGQTYHIIQNYGGSLYALSFKKIMNRKGTVLGMIAAFSKISGFINFDNQALAKNYYIVNTFNHDVLFSANGKLELNSNIKMALDSVTQNPALRESLERNERADFITFNDTRLNWLLLTELSPAAPFASKTSFTKYLKMIFASLALVLILLIFFVIKKKDDFYTFLNNKAKLVDGIFSNIENGKFKENENSLAVLLLSEDKSNKILPKDFCHHLRSINHSTMMLHQDKSDLEDILQTRMEEIETLSNEIKKNEQDALGELETSNDKISDISVRLNQLSCVVSDIGIWQTINEISARLQSDFQSSDLKNITANLKTKSNIIIDKIDKTFLELSHVSKIADHAYLISINSSIFAEKANSEKLTVLSNEISKLSDSLNSAADRIFYLLTETKSGASSCQSDSDMLVELNQATPSRSDLSDLAVEFTRVNEKVTIISEKINEINDEQRDLLSLNQSAKSSLESTKSLFERINHTVGS